MFQVTHIAFILSLVSPTGADVVCMSPKDAAVEKALLADDADVQRSDLHMLQLASSPHVNQTAKMNRTAKQVMTKVNGTAMHGFKMSGARMNATAMIDIQLRLLEKQKEDLMRLRANATAMSADAVECASCISLAVASVGTCTGLDPTFLTCAAAVSGALPNCINCPTAMCTALAPAHLLCFEAAGGARDAVLSTGLVDPSQLNTMCTECAGWTDPVGSVVASAADSVVGAVDGTVGAVSGALGSVADSVSSWFR